MGGARKGKGNATGGEEGGNLGGQDDMKGKGKSGKGKGKGGKSGKGKGKKGDGSFSEGGHFDGHADEPPQDEVRGKGKGKSKGKKGKNTSGNDLGLQQGPRVVDPAKAREVLIGWLMKTYKMPREFAESPEGISESATQMRGRGSVGPLYTCALVIPSLGLGPFAGEASPKRKASSASAYVAAVTELGIPIPPKAAVSMKMLQMQEQKKMNAELKAEQQRNKQRELQERRAAQKAAAKLEAEQKLRARCRQVFQDKLWPQVQESLPVLFPFLELPPAVQVSKGGDRQEQKAASDLSNLCNKDPSLFDGAPAYFERSETITGSGSFHFAVAMVKMKGSGDGANLAPVLGCAFGSKRGTVKAAAARQCVKRIVPKATLPVAAEMAEELERLQRHGVTPSPEVWAGICNQVSEIRKLEAKGAAGLRLAVIETSEGSNMPDGLSGPFRCILTGRVPQEHGLKDFKGISKKGQCSLRLAIAAACEDALARLTSLFGGGDVAEWLRRMVVTPMELEDLPWEISKGLWQAEQGSEERERELKARLQDWSQQRAARCAQVAIAPDLSAGACEVVPDKYVPPKGDGSQDPREKAKRARGVPLLPVRSLRHPLAKILKDESALVVSGGTGSGKSTQLPQFIVDDWVGLEEGKKRRPRVIVTQPRRIAAISVAERVAWERGESIGESVGYTVRNDAKPPRIKDGSIEFCTVGILLRRLMDARDPNLSRYTHVLVDEVHERDLMTDFLLILLKELLVRRGDVRVILMSATLDVTTFSTYFWDCPVLEVPSGPRYPVEECYLEDMIHNPEMEALQAMQYHQQMAAAAQHSEYYANGSSATGSLNPAAAEFVPTSAPAWQPQETEGEAEKEAEEDVEEEWDEQAEEDGEDQEGDDGEEDEDEDEEEEDDEVGQAEQGNEELLQFQNQAPRFKEYVSWDLQKLSEHLLKKEESSRRAFEAEQAELKAEKAETGGQNAEVEEAGEGEGPGDEASFGGTGLWWGSFEDGEPLFDLCARLLIHLVFKAHTEQGGIFDDQGKPGSILVFLPGWAEIKSVMERLLGTPQAEALWVLPLHSTLAKEDQQKIFQHPPEGKTKVILSTNIAESSVTIDDVLIVVDAGLMRELSYDPVRRLSTLETVWVSQSSSIQRKGRAGRVRNGKCYRLFSRTQFESTPWRTAPEMQRCELSATCLQALAMQREVRDFLARAPDPPALSAVESALRELVQLGAIAPPQDASKPSENGTVPVMERMLPLGETLSRMPLSPSLGRMLILGVLFQCVDTACLLAAVISATRRPFVCPPGKRKESLAFQRGFDASSDLLVCFTAAEVFEKKLVAPHGHRRRDEEDADRFCMDRFLMPQRLRQLLRARDSLREELVRAKLVDRAAAHKKYNAPGEQDDEDADDEEIGIGNWEEGDRHEGHHYWTKQWEDPAFAALHAHEEEKELRKALLVAAYPTNLAMRRRPFLAKHRTPTGLEAIVAPQSLNAQPRAGKGGGKEATDRRGGPSWWAYGSMQISNKQGFLRTTTLVDPYHIVLFGGLSVEYRQGKGGKGNVDKSQATLEGLEGGGIVSTIDEWMELNGSSETIRQLSYLRDEIRRCIHLKVLDPGNPLPDASQWLLDAVATGVLRTAARRQNRILGLLPAQQVLPPGGSVKEEAPPHPALPTYSPAPQEDWDSGWDGYDSYGSWGGSGGRSYGGKDWGQERWSQGGRGKGKGKGGGKYDGHPDSGYDRGRKGQQRPSGYGGSGGQGGRANGAARDGAPQETMVWQ
mmetsp:Transcript_7082/g.12665  ORF Transcript_7082/g.12665 Transcript_7082/m.12665 type:complete len:1750 (-) Transcript_7082:83-5332(-)